MPTAVRIAFERRVLVLPLSKILPLRSVLAAVRTTTRFRRIAASIAEVGIIEPLVVARPKTKEKGYLLLDGHMRLAILWRSWSCGGQLSRCG